MKTLHISTESYGSVSNVMNYNDDIHTHARFKLCHQPTHQIVLCYSKCQWLLVGASYYLARCLTIINFNIQRKLVNSPLKISLEIYYNNEELQIVVDCAAQAQVRNRRSIKRIRRLSDSDPKRARSWQIKRRFLTFSVSTNHDVEILRTLITCTHLHNTQ